MTVRLRFYWRRLVAWGRRDRWGYCLRCGDSWQSAARHETWLKIPRDRLDRRPLVSGIFPLCEPCWVVLPVVEKLVYYRRLWVKLAAVGQAPAWEIVERAVQEER